MPFKHKHRSKQTPFFKKPLFRIITAVLIAAGVFGALEIMGVINVFNRRNPGLATQVTTPNRTGGVSTKGETADATNIPDSNVTENDNKLPNDPDGTPLKEPGGNFVSNHQPNISGHPSPNEIQSNCVTTTGATCTIVFTKGSEVKQLPVQNTDREGAAYWSWSLQNIGLTAGKWKVQAKAVLGSQVKTTDDALALEVSP